MRHHIIFVLMITSINNCFAQATEEHHLFKFTQNDGLSSYNIRSIIQDPMGFIWIATQDGLNRFDGKSFDKYNYNTRPDRKILSSDVRCLAIDTFQHLIWVLTNTEGINSIDYYNGKVTNEVITRTIDNNDWNTSMVLYNNKLWIGCMNGIKIYNISLRKWEHSPVIPFSLNSAQDLLSVRTIHADEYGNIWVFVNHYGIAIIDAYTNQVTQVVEANKLKNNSTSDILFTSVIKLSSNIMLVGTSEGIKSIFCKHKKIILFNHTNNLIKALSHEKIRTMLKSHHHIYIATATRLLKMNYSLSNWMEIIESNANENESWLQAIYNLYADNEDNVWLGCKEGAAFLPFHKSPFEGFSNKMHVYTGLNHVYSVVPLNGNYLLLGLEKGLASLNKSSKTIEFFDRKKSFNSSFTDFNGNLIVSSDDGMFVLTKSKLIPITHIYQEFSPVSNCLFNSTVFIGDSICIIGSDNDRGILVWNYKKRTLYTINDRSYPAKLRSNIVNKVFKDTRGKIWILSDRGIDVLEENLSFVKPIDVNDPLTKLPFKLFFDICEVGNKFWITSYGYGVVEINEDSQPLRTLRLSDSSDINTHLCDNGVYKIFNYRNEELIITSNNGLSFYDMRNNKLTNYYEYDGLHSNAFEEACGIQKDGLIYAGGLNGFTIIDPSLRLIHTTPPILYFTAIQVDESVNEKLIKTNTINLQIQKQNIPSTWLQASISFVGLNYTNPTRVTYQYRIIERDTSWLDIGTQNFVNFIGLDPGTYTLEVKAANEDGYWSPVKQLILTFEPKWYQTWSFKILVVLIITALLFAFFRYRINQIRKQHKIRKEIASDLYDNIGSSLNTVKIFTHLAKKEPDKESYLNEIESSLTSATTGLRDMLWVLDDSQDTAFELVERVRKFVLPVLKANNIRLDARVEADEHKALSKAEKKNLYLIAKESINNSIKYADCRNISLHIHQANGKTTALIQDDGRGFDTGKQSEGNGLKNIRERARQIHYLVDISSSSDKGTTIRLTKK